MSPRCCISSKLLGDADAAVLRPQPSHQVPNTPSGQNLHANTWAKTDCDAVSPDPASPPGAHRGPRDQPGPLAVRREEVQS